jgi:hypothetical protein
MRRGDRYGLVVLIRRNGLSIQGEIWSTQGVTDWDAHAWESIDEEEIEAETGALRVVTNGPLVWLPNSATDSTQFSKRKTFGGLEMSLLLTLEIDPRQRSKPYQERQQEVQRQATFTFNRGEEVYELTSPRGFVYVMQSMAQTVDAHLTLDALPTIGSRLDLPRGWTYRARTLDADLVLTVSGEATVIQDDLKNTYQRR